jgi:RNA polymerase sigma factor (sigma-70 family)
VWRERFPQGAKIEPLSAEVDVPLDGQKDEPVSRIPLTVSEEELAALQSGDEVAWHDFLPRATPIIQYVVAWPRWHFDEQVREDLLRRIQSALPQALSQFAGQASVHTLIRRISVYQCIDEVRRQIRERKVFLNQVLEGEEEEAPLNEVASFPAGEEFDPVKTILKLELAEIVHQGMASLSSACTEVIRFCYLEGLSYKEMSSRLGISINSVGPRLASCYERFKENIKKNPVLRDYFSMTRDYV